MSPSLASSTPFMAPQAMFDLAMAEETLADAPGTQADAPPDEPGTVIADRYILKSLLGEGSSGFVWRAEQTEPVRRDVAVKIIRPGLVAEPVSARFNREHQVLARMEHPNIAAVFDAGELPDGRTFFAMELVDGMPITSWCARHETVLRQRLEIFLQACLAVQHAHQKGILHRDLKPSNVLVTMASGAPLVKVIDFGIAKALSPDLTPGLDVTLRGMVLGTPRYMSPEQAGLTGQDVDTRTDVFALGVLLYELLTGTTPVGDEDGQTSSLPELLQRVRHTEAERPSRRVTRVTSHGMPPQTPARRLARELSGDLDWIVLKALQNDREQRYPAVSALVEDVQRHLRHEPVSAGPPGLAYRIKKWRMRHRGMLTAVAAVLCVSLVGLAATWWALDREAVQRSEAERQQRRAQEQARLAEKVSGQLGDLLVSARKYVDAGLNTELLRQIADECAAGMSRFAGSPLTEARLIHQLGDLYDALEEKGAAIQWFTRHWEVLRDSEGRDAYPTLIALYELGWRAVDHSMARQSVDWLREAADGLDRFPVAVAEALSARKELARALSRAGRHEEAVQMFATVMQKADASQPKLAVWLREQADALNSAGRSDEAVVVMEKAMQKLPPDDAGARSYVLSGLASLYEARNHWDAALEASSQYIKVLETQSGASHSKILNALIQHAFLACKCPGCPGGEEAARRALALARDSGTRLAAAWTAWCEVLRVTRRYTESEEATREAIAYLSTTKVEPWRLRELRRRLGDLLVERGKFEEALQEYEVAAEGVLEPDLQGRPRVNEELILSSFVRFWERAMRAGSPVADEEQLAIWRANYEAWKGARLKQAAVR
ncbi:MAG: protein kinase domain-containing protein [Prosthecobacter sp.]